VLRLDRERFKTLVREQPSSFLAIARVLSRRLASANRTRLVEEQALAARVESSLERLTPWLHLDLASVALLGLLAATIAGASTVRRSRHSTGGCCCSSAPC
jgi:CRP-like cAMP-binding protein